jgi:hypothetical protein
VRAILSNETIMLRDAGNILDVVEARRRDSSEIFDYTFVHCQENISRSINERQYFHGFSHLTMFIRKALD